MNSTYTKLGRAAAITDGANLRGLLASNRQAAEAARYEAHVVKFILDNFTAKRSGSVVVFQDGDVRVARVDMSGTRECWTSCNIEVNFFMAAARAAMKGQVN